MTCFDINIHNSGNRTHIRNRILSTNPTENEHGALYKIKPLSEKLIVEEFSDHHAEIGGSIQINSGLL